MTNDLYDPAFGITILIAKIRDLYHNFMTGDRTFCIGLCNINIFCKLMIISYDKTIAFTAGVRSDKNRISTL